MKLINNIIPNPNLVQIPQDVEVLFSFANIKDDEVHIMHDLVRCRDFLGDIVLVNYKKKPDQIYEFRTDPIKHILDETTNLVLRFNTKKQETNFLKNYKKILNPIEQDNNLTETKVIQLEEKCILVIGDPFWQKKIFMISLYSYLLKVACYGIKKTKTWQKTLEEAEKETNETKYYEKTKEKLPWVLENLQKIAESSENPHGYKTNDIYRIHNDSGFVSILTYTDFYIKENTIAKFIKESIT